MLISAHAGKLPLADDSVQCVVTSPPYWGLRKYAGEQELIWMPWRIGAEKDIPDGQRQCDKCDHRWGEQIIENATNYTDKARWQHTRNGRDELQPPEKRVGWKRSDVAQDCICSKCGAWRGGYGLEPTIEMYVAHTVEILREIRRVLRADGVCFWNIGDSYCANRGNTEAKPGQDRMNPIGDGISIGHKRSATNGALKPKDLCLIPARVALAAQDDGWWVRSMIIWAKPNPMPESVTDRPTDAYEHILMLTKSQRYFWDADAVREAATGEPSGNLERVFGQDRDGIPGHPSHLAANVPWAGAATRNMRNVWAFPTQPYSGAHFATFPEEIPRRAILAATSARGACRQCGAPWRRVSRREIPPKELRSRHSGPDDGLVMGFGSTGERYGTGQKMQDWLDAHPRETIGWQPTCRCRGQHGHVKPCLVLDPFGGSGTTGKVATKLGRDAVLCDLAYGRSTAEDAAKGRDYAALADRRTRNVQRPLPVT